MVSVAAGSSHATVHPLKALIRVYSTCVTFTTIIPLPKEGERGRKKRNNGKQQQQQQRRPLLLQVYVPPASHTRAHIRTHTHTLPRLPARVGATSELPRREAGRVCKGKIASQQKTSPSLLPLSFLFPPLNTSSNTASQRQPTAAAARRPRAARTPEKAHRTIL